MANGIAALVIEDLLDKEITRGKTCFAFPAHERSEDDPIVNIVARRIGDDNYSIGIHGIYMLDLRNKDANELVKNSVLYSQLISGAITLNPRPRWFVAVL